MRTFQRWFYRIFIPVLIVGLVGAILRWVMMGQFAERNVLPPEQGIAQRQSASSLPFSEENKQHVIAALDLSKSQLDRSLQKAELESEAAREARDRAALLEESIQELKNADDSTWEAARDRAYERLGAYAATVRRASGSRRS